MCINVWPACKCVHSMHACCLWKSEEGFGAPTTGVMDGSEPPCGSLELNTDPLARVAGVVHQ